jgi:hypothetical protein
LFEVLKSSRETFSKKYVPELKCGIFKFKLEFLIRVALSAKLIFPSRSQSRNQNSDSGFSNMLQLTGIGTATILLVKNYLKKYWCFTNALQTI